MAIANHVQFVFVDNGSRATVRNFTDFIVT
jgi:hypothetical protein